jgi:hypothetical protein
VGFAVGPIIVVLAVQSTADWKKVLVGGAVGHPGAGAAISGLGATRSCMARSNKALPDQL